MKKYNILSDYEKQRTLKKIENECRRLKKPKYWVLQQLNIPKSTYYDWVRTGGKTKSKAPNTVWNKTPEIIEDKIIELRKNVKLYQSERTPNGIARKLEEDNIFMSSGGIWKVLKRHGDNRKFVKESRPFLIYPKADKFLDVVCIDDIMLSNRKPRDIAVFNAIDEFSQASVAISFVKHRVNKYDVIKLIERIRANYGKLPKIVRLDNAKAHISLMVKKYCLKNNIELQFIDKGVPQQNWPVESFNGVIRRDLIETSFWDWDDLAKKQTQLDDYRQYYNSRKRLNSDPLKRTPNEIATAITSKQTQNKLKYKLLRKHYGQKIAREAMLDMQAVLLSFFVRNVR